MRIVRWVTVAAIAMAFASAAVRAQGAATGASSGATLSAAGQAMLRQLVDSARGLGLPTEPLTAKAAEGALKGASEERILLAVHSLLRELGDARTALSRHVSTGTLVAAASALHAGVSVEGLRRVAAQPGATDGALGVAFVTLADIVANRVPAGVATEAIGSLVGRGASEAEMTALRLDVARDVSAGRAPGDALQARVQELMRRGMSRP